MDDTERERRREQEEHKRRQVRLQCEVALGIVESIITRQSQISDPAAKHLLLADKLCFFIDGMIGATQAFMSDNNVESDLKERAERAGKKLQAQLLELMEWIQHPVYSPDHPFGNKIMKDAQADLASHAATQTQAEPRL